MLRGTLLAENFSENGPRMLMYTLKELDLGPWNLQSESRNLGKPSNHTRPPDDAHDPETVIRDSENPHAVRQSEGLLAPSGSKDLDSVCARVSIQ